MNELDGIRIGDKVNVWIRTWYDLSPIEYTVIKIIKKEYASSVFILKDNKGNITEELNYRVKKLEPL